MAQSSPTNAHLTPDNTVSSVFTPGFIKERKYYFSNETLGLMSDAEIAYTRLDTKSTRFRYGASLRRTLANLEALATIVIDGVKPDLETLYILEAIECAKQDGQGTGIAYRHIPSDKECAAAHAALLYSDLVLRIAAGSSNIEFNRSTLLDLHEHLRYADDEDDAPGVHFRQQPFKPRTNFKNPVQHLYVAPEPEAIPALIDDLMDFCNKPNLSPTTQAAVAHFQLESIRPFKTAMDRTGRAMCHMIMKKRMLYKHLVPPIALVPAMNIPIHAELLFPYKFNRLYSPQDEMIALDRWTHHCAECLVLSVKLVQSLMSQINALEDSWAAQLSGVRQGSAVDIILQELPGMPICTVSTAMATSGKSFSTVNDAIQQLVDANILTPLSNNHRNRAFESVEAMELLQTIGQQAIPTAQPSRESVVS